MARPNRHRIARALLAAAALAAAPALSAADPDTADIVPAEAAERDALFASLAAAATEAEARALESAIWEIWLTAPDARAQELLDRALDRRRWHDFAGALEPLDELVAAYPDYAEGWNQRATVRFLREEYEQSLADIAQTLAREPRHFGALAGKAIILMRQGRTAEAQLVLIQALEIDPWLRERGLLLPGPDL